jgi:1-deoxy-D-xylulose 5-phosphate reductoisomerase
MKSLTILGSTGSIGTNALSIVEKFPKRFAVNALTAHTSVEALARQIGRLQSESGRRCRCRASPAFESAAPRRVEVEDRFW